MALEAGTKLADYEILGPIGSGGMGEVYKAKDLKLGRYAAIKVLTEASDSGRLRRFEQEARAASALNHPNIVHIYGIGEHQNTPYIAMEYVDGATLREALSGGPLPNEKLLRYVTQIAEGLGKAHQAGIVHRDLKPENLMITDDGHAKILDFGLAKLLPGLTPSDSHSPTQTKEGTATGAVMGTASYMSPEQALGKPLDARTDVFSLGAVLYEMATGARPFQGETLAALFDEILHKKAPPPSRLNTGLPTGLDGITERALAKDPEKRYPSAKEFLADLHQLSPHATVRENSAPRSVVVLPFQNVSPDPEQEYFCDGLTDEIISNLSNVQSLRVISRTSSMQFKGTNKNITTIGEELNVQCVLEGSVRKAGNNLRITAQLIDATNDAQLWAERYSGTLDDIFDVQEKVSRSIVDALEINLSPEEKQKIAERPFDNIEAYECYHRARQEMGRLTTEGLERALKDLQVGLDIVGENILLYAGMAEVYLLKYEMGVSTGEDTLENVENLSRKITALQPDSALGYYLAGRLERFRGSVLKAAEYLEQALERDPNHSNTLLFLGILYAHQIGKTFLGRPLIARLIEIDPLTPLSLIALGVLQWMEGRLDEALETFHKVTKLQPDAPFQNMWIAHIWARQKRYSELAALAEQLVQRGWEDVGTELCLFYEAGVNGGATTGPRALSEDTKTFCWKDPDLAWLVADAYALHGDKDEALRWLERTVERDWINYPLWKNDPLLESVRGEKRFQRLMEEVKHKWDSFVRFDPTST